MSNGLDQALQELKALPARAVMTLFPPARADCPFELQCQCHRRHQVVVVLDAQHADVAHGRRLPRDPLCSFLNGRHEVVVVFNAEHANIPDRRMKPLVSFGQILNRQHAGHCIDLFIAEINASLLPIQAVFSQRFPDFPICVSPGGIAVGLFQGLRIEIASHGEHGASPCTPVRVIAKSALLGRSSHNKLRQTSPVSTLAPSARCNQPRWSWCRCARGDNRSCRPSWRRPPTPASASSS